MGLLLLLPAIAAAQTLSNSRIDWPRIHWDPSTLKLIQKGGVYARMTRTSAGLLCCFEHNGDCWTRQSNDEGKTWQPEVRAVHFEFGNAANPDLLACRDGRVILFYNRRPSDHAHRYAIAMAVSRDNGSTWTETAKPLYEAGSAEGTGCYEPSAIQLSTGEIQLFFANEFPHKTDGTQEITLLRSTDNGETWNIPRAVSYRAGHRDGMPVPVVLANQKGIAFAIEDNGVTADREFKPSIIRSSKPMEWSRDSIGAESPQRWPAVLIKWPAHTYAGAPYLRQLPTGQTVLSCQSARDGKPPQMVVYLGDADAKHFTSPSNPFPGSEQTGSEQTGSEQTRQMWNALFVKNRDTVTALSSTSINGVRGVWAIDGHVITAER